MLIVCVLISMAASFLGMLVGSLLPPMIQHAAATPEAIALKHSRQPAMGH